ncbi:sensor histidine kinase [Sulfitobacter sp.]|uniref:sensor histidine kinase n=1 Tax=Sulfitobacter sp. TaxID=1903071 RepID=UPI00300341A4
MDGLLAKDLRHVRFSIMDGDEVIYDEHSVEDPMADVDRIFSEKISVNLYGMDWLLDMRSDLAFRQDNAQLKPELILVAGLISEGFIVALLFMMARANRRAVAYADIVTQRLKEKSAKLAYTNEQLSEKNEQLEQYAYVASHDLKTPIRGIGGLTEMVQEDLEGYFNSPDANPEVRELPCRILERVERMHQLTGGIHQFSQIVTVAVQNEPLDLTALVAGLRVDFGLSDEQVVLIGDCKVMDVDTINFRGVLENLIGNAIKYHDGSKPLEITVSAMRFGDNAHVSVADNGPGIDPKFHDRIFDVFQTLRRADIPESIGIGLAIVKKSVERHGNSLKSKSSLGNGAMFSFDWPTVAGTNVNRTTTQAV